MVPLKHQMANNMADKVSPNKRYKLLQSYAGHSPAPWRVNVALSNMPEFAQDFNCPAGIHLAKLSSRYSLVKNYSLKSGEHQIQC